MRDAKSLAPVGDARASSLRNVLSFFWTADAEERVVVEVQSAPVGETGGFLYIFTEASDDAGDSPDTAVSQPVTETEYTFEGFLETPDDVDVWRISIPTNHVLRVYCSGTRDDPNMEMIRPDGTLLGRFRTSYFSGGIAELGAKNAVGDDLILLFRTGSPRAPVATRYLCRVRDIGPDAPPDATAVTVPARVNVGFRSVDDVDVLAVDLVGGRDYLLKDESGSSSPYYCATTVMDAQSQVLKTDLPSDRDGVTYTAPATGRYFLSLKRGRGDGLWKWLIPEGFLFAITEVTP